MTDVRYWQPATLYQPEDVVQANFVPAVNVEQPLNANFELGNQDWTLDTEFAINDSGTAFDGTFRAVYSGSSNPPILGIIAEDSPTDRRVYITSDGDTVPYTETSVAAKHIAGNGSIFIALNDSAAFSSTDGITWSAETPTWAAVELDMVHWDSNTSLFYAFEAATDKYHTSPDGMAWTQRTFPITDNNGANETFLRRSMATNGSITVVYNIVSRTIYSTTDGISWTLRDTLGGAGFGGQVVYAASLGRFVAISNFRQTFESTDGITWVQTINDLVSKGFSSLNGISLAWSPVVNRFVVLAHQFTQGATTDRVATSDDGITWTLRNSFDGRWVRWSETLQQFVHAESAGVNNRGRLNRSSTGTGWSQTEYDAGQTALIEYPMAELNPAQGTFTATNDQKSTVIAGQTIGARCQVLSSSTGSGKIGISWYDSGASLIKTDYGSLVSGASASFREAAVSATAPSGAVSASVTLGGTGVGEVIFDAVVWDYFFQASKSGLLYKAVQASAGYSGSNEPAFDPDIGDTVVDNQVTWETIEANCIVWQANPILVSDSTEPTFPTEIGATVADNTILWTAETRRVQDTNCPNSKTVAIAASKVFSGDDDIVAFSATVNPLDWTTAEDAGYIPFGLNTYGSDPVSALGIYRSNLVIFNGKAFQMWQVDEDPNNFAILDAVPVGCNFHRSLAPVANDLVFLTDEGIRSMGIAGASTNLQAGFFGKQIDPLVLEAIKGGEIPNGLFFPGAGQYWLFFGEEAFVLTMNGGKADMSWSRYVFPSAIDDWAIQGAKLYLRSGDKIWEVDDDTFVDDFGGDDVEIVGRIWWPYLDFGALGVTKELIGVDVVATGEYALSIGYNQNDTTQVTDPYTIDGDTVVGDIIPIPISAPSFQLRLEFTNNGINDPYYDNVIFLSHFDGVDGAQEATDVSSLAHPLTFVDDAEITTDQSKFGGASLGVNNSTQPADENDAVTWPVTDDFNFAARNWTIELEYYADESAGANALLSIGTTQGGEQEMLNIVLSNGNIAVEWVNDGAGTDFELFTVPHVNGTWQHLAIVRENGFLRCYLEGTQSTTGPAIITDTLIDPLGFCMLGGSSNATTPLQEFQGYIDEVRITTDVVRYDDDFTPPTSAFAVKENVAWEWSAAALHLQDFRSTS